MIMVDTKAPDFERVTAYKKGDFTEVNLADYKGKWLVFFFYPRDFTFICPTELKAFAEHAADFAGLKCEVLAASTDSKNSHKAWFERDLPQVGYPVLADTTHAVSKAYQVFNEKEGLAERGLFVIDPEGMVKYSLISSGNVGRSVKEVLRVVQALQTGDLCPVEWHSGEKTLGKA